MKSNSYTSFYINDILFGINILLVREVNRHLAIHPLFQVPDIVRGTINLRGQIVTILDLGVRLEAGYRTIGADTHCLILKTQQELIDIQADSEILNQTAPDQVGFLVDRIGENITVGSDRFISQATDIGGIKQKYISSIAKLDKDLMIIPDLFEILKIEE